MTSRKPDAAEARLDAERPSPGPVASIGSRRGLDWFVFFLADIQTGFGPFIAVYLTAQKWTQTDIGFVLTASGLVSLFGQIPAGAVVDASRFLRTAAAVAVTAIGLSALALAVWPVFPVVLASRVVHAAASCVLGVALASLSLNLVGRAALGERLGRNASFASVGTGLAAAGMGACGYFLSNRAVFFIAAALVIPALAALFRIAAGEVDPARSGPDTPAAAPDDVTAAALPGALLGLARNRPLMVFAACVVMFHLANAALLPLAASMVTLRSSSAATAMVAAAIVVPQVIVAVLSPLVGLWAQRWGRRPLLLIGFAALPLRALLFAFVIHPRLLVAVQLLDGVSAAVLGVLLPLTVADVTLGRGRFNLAQGAVGTAVGIGASISATAAGLITDRYGSHAAFLTLAVLALAGFAVLALFMPETRPPRFASAPSILPDGRGGA